MIAALSRQLGLVVLACLASLTLGGCCSAHKAQVGTTTGGSSSGSGTAGVQCGNTVCAPSQVCVAGQCADSSGVSCGGGVCAPSQICVNESCVVPCSPSGSSSGGTPTPNSDLTTRVTANAASFYVYLDQDSALNHGFPSGFFAGDAGSLGSVHVDTGCIDDPTDTTTGCQSSASTTALDLVHGTVMRISIDPQPSGSWAGLNIEEPRSWGVLDTGTGYDLTGADGVTFEVRSPNGAQVQFGVGGCTWPYTSSLPATWTPMTYSFSDGGLSCPPNQPLDLSDVHLLFGVASNDQHDATGATVLLDDVQFAPVPARTSQFPETLSLPLSTQTFGVVPQMSPPFPPDQVDRNTAAIYESAATILALLDANDATDAQSVADALDYALYHDNEGDYLSTVPDGGSGCYSGNAATQCGLHNAYESGDIAFLNDQVDPDGGAVTAKAGDSRLAGFTCGPTSANGYCLVLDGATGGNNAWAILALLAEYRQSGNAKYLDDAIAIGSWIIANLQDTTGTGFGGYYAGYADQGALPPKPLNLGKSTENNADIFAAFTALATVDSGDAAAWTSAANAAGDFVMRMFDSTNGRFNTGTVPVGTPAGTPGICPTGPSKGNDVINGNSSPDCDFLDADTFTTLAMAASPRYANFQLADGGVMDWTRPINYVLSTFPQSVTAAGQTFQGFDIVTSPLPGADGGAVGGVGWEFTGQVVETMQYLDQIDCSLAFETTAQSYLADIQLAQMAAPFGDGQGLVASTLQDGDTLPPLGQCLNTPFQNCLPERVGLAATAWMIFAEQQINPLSPSY